ncbi:MAG TPA: SET domain-containing protein-lysine N-methyltransferase [Arenimonas sp.]|nr:SET domain-containing protein-lysine N-methyltransferase [Arenimonas sp.]
MSKKIQARRSKIHGTGVFAKKDIAKGESVIEYKGLIRTHDEVDSDYEGLDETGHTFLFSLNDKYVIDANIDGNDARWINHSCKPNCEAMHEESTDGNPKNDRVLIEAARNIKAGEELTYNYGIRLAERHTPKLKKLWRCLCGSKNCTGTLLQPKK